MQYLDIISESGSYVNFTLNESLFYYGDTRPLYLLLFNSNGNYQQITLGQDSSLNRVRYNQFKIDKSAYDQMTLGDYDFMVVQPEVEVDDSGDPVEWEFDGQLGEIMPLETGKLRVFNSDTGGTVDFKEDNSNNTYTYGD